MTQPFVDRFRLDIDALREAEEGADPGILDGSRIADALEEQVADVVSALKEEGPAPTLAVVRIGDDPASEIYVKHKTKACRKLGIESRHVHRGGDISESDLLGLLDELSADDEVDGLLLQLPLPNHIDPYRCIEHIEPTKDVDGFHPQNLGCLMAGKGHLEACTPRGVMTLLQATGVDIQGKNAVVVGRSRTVGRPMAQMLVRADATVTVCHRHTDDLAAEVGRSDIVVVATGVPELVDGTWIKDGAIVVDVGISREDSGSLVGDVEFEPARKRASLITPVPGGVGPMTVATLMENTTRAALIRRGLVWDGNELTSLEEIREGACADYRR
jgi:methylenetetrahydrofolate dehydrogenase (NADP+)/methenyltetrahydrofolate cyclohydrolase